MPPIKSESGYSGVPSLQDSLWLPCYPSRGAFALLTLIVRVAHFRSLVALAVRSFALLTLDRSLLSLLDRSLCSLLDRSLCSLVDLGFVIEFFELFTIHYSLFTIHYSLFPVPKVFRYFFYPYFRHIIRMTNMSIV